MGQNNIEDVRSLLKDTVELYPSVLKKAIAKKFKEDGLVTSRKKDLKDGCHFPIYSSNSEETIANTLTDEKCFGYYENIEYEKCYKYSIPLFFELDNVDFEKRVKQLAANNKIIVFNENDKLSVSDLAVTNIHNCIPTYKKSGNYFLIKFLIKQNTFKFENGGFIPVDIRFPIIISINPTIGMLEIRFDGGKFDADSQIDFITPIFRHCMQWLKDNLLMKLYNVNSDNTIECIKNDSTKKAVIYRQFMEMKSGASADLTASDNDGNIMPFIGEIRALIKNNEEVFDRCIESKRLLENYLDEQEETANYPYIHIKWLAATNALEFSVKITSNYYNGKYIQIHSMQNSARVMKERMEYAIEYLFESGSFTKGEEV